VNQPPETRASLLVRLKDRADQAAWYEFAEIYRPVIVRLAGRRGMQPADAEDLAQEVLAAVARGIDRWQEDPRRARFRTWLHRVARTRWIPATLIAPTSKWNGFSTSNSVRRTRVRSRSTSKNVRLASRR